MPLNGSLASGSCQVQTGSGTIGSLNVRAGPSRLLMLLTGAAVGFALHYLLLRRERDAE